MDLRGFDAGTHLYRYFLEQCGVFENDDLVSVFNA